MRSLLLLIVCLLTVFTRPLIIGGDGHDQLAQQIIQLNNYLEEKSVDELRQCCLKLENYTREGGKIGGVHDYVRLMDKQDLIEYILHTTEDHKELLDLNKFQSLMDPHSTLTYLEEDFEEPSAYLSKSESSTRTGGLHDYIWNQDNETLRKWALTCESHDRNVKNLHLFGGLHDYIGSMTNKQLGEYIMKKVDEYPQLNSASVLNEYAERYGFSH